MRSEIQKNPDIPERWETLAARLANLTKQNTMDGEINLVHDAIVEELIKIKDTAKRISKNSKPNNARKHSRKTKGKPPNRAEKRKYAFAKCQELMNKCPKKLADIVVANDLSLLQIRHAPGTAETRELYRNLWGMQGSKQIPQRPAAAPTLSIADIFQPITTEEVEGKIKHIANSSAAGVDGITKLDLKGKGTSAILAKLFNVLLLNKAFPSSWKQNRTTLIPKVGKDPTNVKNWRPITISSMLSRIFSSLLDRRLRNVIRQSDRQKGFTSENGCFANTRLLSAAIAEAKNSDGVFAILDISKAFDTVLHEAIRSGLERKGIPAVVANYIVSTYIGCKTIIKTRDGEIPIELKRGVKQGDPLSPLLFNLIVEPIIEMVQSKSQEINIEGHNLAVMAFADDMILLAHDRETAVDQLNTVVSELKNRGMALSIEKSSVFQYVPRGKTWFVRNPEITIEEIPVPYGEPGQTFKYLGASVTPWKGLIEGFELDTLQEIIKRVRALPIKPMQKILLLRTYLLPRFTYRLVMRPPSRETLRNIDLEIRSGVKKILHIHETTSTAFLYTLTREGGLGLLEIYPMVFLAALRNAIKAAQSTDDMVRQTITNERSQKLYGSYAAALHLP